MAEYKAKLFKNGGGKGEVIYADTEHIIGYVEINGVRKDLYEKTISCGALRSTAGNQATAHNISNLDKIYYVYGVARKDNKQTLPLPTTAVDSLTNQIVCYADATNINIYVATNYSAYTSSEVTLHYTKTA